ncbi:MAG: hypothetical protein LC753_01700 [Acidobacteria bacterium]|nr:hypothetical protein [Acidobacteriota bacterium]
MATVTGIELGPDSCVLVRVRTGRGEPQLSAARLIETTEWPPHDVAVTELLAGVKRELRLPGRARVVVWGAPDSANVADLASLVALRPIVAAGFKIDSILSPPKALALLAASRARPCAQGAQAWLALNCHGVAIAIVRGGELLVSRTFGWNYGSPSGGPNAQLLQRYSLVAHLAPEVRHAIEMAAVSHGVTVELVVTCGDLPELRSLTMPLIEELDIEVETLDSTEGLSV